MKVEYKKPQGGWHHLAHFNPGDVLESAGNTDFLYMLVSKAEGKGKIACLPGFQLYDQDLNSGNFRALDAVLRIAAYGHRVE